MAKAPTIKLPVCDTCKQAFTPGQAILTSVSCGHNFHKSQQCFDALDISQRFERVDVYSGGCRVDDCEYDGNLVKNSSEASPTTLLFRNLPLEGIVKTSSMQSSSRSAMIPVIEIPSSHKRGESESAGYNLLLVVDTHTSLQLQVRVTMLLLRIERSANALRQARPSKKSHSSFLMMRMMATMTIRTSLVNGLHRAPSCQISQLQKNPTLRTMKR